VEGKTETVVAISGLEEGIVDQVTSLQISFKLVLEVHLVHGGVSSNDGSGFKSAVSHHVEDIDDVVLEAVGLEVGVFMIIVHFELTTRHLNHTVVDGFISVQDGFIVGLLDGVESTRSFVGFISSTDIEEDTHINNIGEDLGFGNDGDSVFELSHFVVSGSVLSVLDFMVFKGEQGVEDSSLVMRIREVLSIENFKEGSLKVEAAETSLRVVEVGADERS
jgi:hypothetical protein